mgnify:CR=1 FL=1
MATAFIDTNNTFFRIAADLVNQSARNIFLTGKAGTGKTTFLKYIRDHCIKELVVVAPTGVAAINAGGVTIHSFFQLPFGPFTPEPASRHQLVSQLRFTAEKKKLIRELELLIIDEISMVRSDVLDAMDTVLRYVRDRHNKVFGGVQVLFIGDMFQLPPVVKDAEWSILSSFYESQYFFDSMAVREEPPVYIEFSHIYRQSEESFIRVLNKVRNNELDEESARLLDSLYQPEFRRLPQDGYIILTTHNNKARDTNALELRKINAPLYAFNAEIKGQFSETAYPADEQLELKEGAQVMFIRNDTAERGKRYFNGKIGTVTRITDDEVYVRCGDNDDEISVERETWENIRYSLNKNTRLLETDVLGSFTQFPLRLAWAITIHKSQGLTFEKAIIDAGESFAPGQVYVALSRCTSLQGIVLKSRLGTNSLSTDPRIVRFSRLQASTGELDRELAEARKKYQEELLLSAFDFNEAWSDSRALKEYLEENEGSFSTGAVEWMDHLIRATGKMEETAGRFRTWLQAQFSAPGDQARSAEVIERTRKAAAYFVPELEQLARGLMQSAVTTDSKLHAKEFNDQLKELFAGLSLRKFLLQDFDGNPGTGDWQKKKKDFKLPAFPVNAYGGATRPKADSPHPVLYAQLKKLRDELCDRSGQPIYMVASSHTLDEMSRYLPQDQVELKKISGFGETRISKYGADFLEIITAYCRERNLVSLIHERPLKPGRKQSRESKKPKKGGRD